MTVTMLSAELNHFESDSKSVSGIGIQIKCTNFLMLVHYIPFSARLNRDELETLSSFNKTNCSLFLVHFTVETLH